MSDTFRHRGDAMKAILGGHLTALIGNTNGEECWCGCVCVHVCVCARGGGGILTLLLGVVGV